MTRPGPRERTSTPPQSGRRSACAAEARRLEPKRVMAMTPLQRAALALALALGRRYAAVAAAARARK